MKPFSTYPEDRAELIRLATILQKPHDVETGEKVADQLSDMVLGILSDEETDKFDEKVDGVIFITDNQFSVIQSALNTAIGFALAKGETYMMKKFSEASSLMDDIANGEVE